MAKPFYVIALFVTMVTSFAALWNINLSSPRVAFYLSRCSPYVHQKASWAATSVFRLEAGGLSWSNYIWKSSEPRVDSPWKLLGAVPLSPSRGFPAWVRHPRGELSGRGSEKLAVGQLWLPGQSPPVAQLGPLLDYLLSADYFPAKGKGWEHNLSGVKFLWV